MPNNIDTLLVAKILENIPHNIKPTDYLMEVLGLSRNAVYRRLRYEKNFSFDEIIKLASLIGFSLDSIVSEANDRLHPDPPQQQEMNANAEQTVISLFEHFGMLLSKMDNPHNSQFIMTINRLQFLSSVEEEPLLRFLYYQLMYQLREIPVNYPFSDVILPEAILEKGKEFHKLFVSVSHKEYIIDSRLYQNIAKDIQYFYQRKLISESELMSLKEYLHNTLMRTQISMQTELNEIPFKKSKTYLSAMEVTSNTVYSIYDGNEESNFWLYSAIPIGSSKKHVCNIHKLWLDSLMRSATLISGVNEELLLDFISKQLSFVDSIDKIMY